MVLDYIALGILVFVVLSTKHLPKNASSLKQSITP